MVSPQKTPERPGMALYAVHPVDDKDCIVQHLQRALHFRREIYMPGGVKECYLVHSESEYRLFRENGDTTAAFQFIGVKICIFMVYTAKLPDLAA